MDLTKNEIPNFGVSTQSLICNANVIGRLRKQFFNFSILDNITNVFGDRSKLIVSCKVFPFSLESTAKNMIKLDNLYLGYISNETKISLQKEDLAYAPWGSSIIYGGKVEPFASFVVDNTGDYDFTDLSPISEYLLYLPFFGEINLDGYVVNKYAIYIDYYLTFESGSIYCVVYYKDNGDVPIYSNSSQISYEIPICGMDTNILKSAIFDTIGSAVNVATGSYLGYTIRNTESISNSSNNVGSSFSVNKTASANLSSRPSLGLKESQSYSSGRTDYGESRKTSTSIQKSVMGGGSAVREVYTAFSNGFNLSIPTSHGSTSNGNSSLYSIRIPYLRKIKHDYRYPKDYDLFIGYPVNEVHTINESSGFTKCESVHLEFQASSDEISEIESLLNSGVIITSTPVPEPPAPEPEPKPEPKPEPIEPIEPETKWLSPWSGAFKVTSTYGEKRTYTATDGKVYRDIHSGLDMVGIGDINVYSIAEGTVEYIGWQDSSDSLVGFGYYCRINTNGKLFYYAHMRANSSKLKVGDKVSKGTKIGIMGSTGRVDGAHLHLEVRANTSPSSHENICSYTLLPNKIGTYE